MKWGQRKCELEKATWPGLEFSLDRWLLLPTWEEHAQAETEGRRVPPCSLVEISVPDRRFLLEPSRWCQNRLEWGADRQWGMVWLVLWVVTVATDSALRSRLGGDIAMAIVYVFCRVVFIIQIFVECVREPCTNSAVVFTIDKSPCFQSFHGPTFPWETGGRSNR